MTIFVSKEGQKLGPFTLEELRSELNKANLAPSDLAWHEQATNWSPISELGLIEKIEKQASSKVAGAALVKVNKWQVARHMAFLWVCSMVGGMFLGTAGANQNTYGWVFAANGLTCVIIALGFAIILLQPRENKATHGLAVAAATWILSVFTGLIFAADNDQVKFVLFINTLDIAISVAMGAGIAAVFNQKAVGH